MCFFNSSEKANLEQGVYLHLENYDLQDEFLSNTN
jgi:hypothetical protein